MAKKSVTTIETLDEETYRESFSRLLHFSFKSINSNTSPGGIRLSVDNARETAPYISTEGALAQGYPVTVDYASMSPPSIATHLKHARIAQGQVEKSEMSDPGIILKVLDQETRLPLELNTDTVEPRLRQILIPLDGEFKDYLSLTPLVSVGLARLLRVTESIKRSESGAKVQRRLARASLQIGGTNSQNVGGFITELQRPMMFTAPQEDRDLKRALGLHYQGMKLKLPALALKRYIQWRGMQLQRGDGHMSGKASVRQKETSILSEITGEVLKQAYRGTQLLESYRETLPGESLVDPGLPLLQQGLLVPERRTREWRTEFAQALARLIADYRLSDETSLGLDSSGIQGVANIIEQATL